MHKFAIQRLSSVIFFCIIFMFCGKLSAEADKQSSGYYFGNTGDGTVPPSPQWAHDAVFYSINIQHFGKPQNPGSYFEKAAVELEYIKKLGANTVVVNPIQTFVDTVEPKFWNAFGMSDPTTISQAYGGAEGFKKFVDKAHSLGLNVIVDIVVRQLYSEGPAAKKLLSDGKYEWFMPGLTKEQLDKPFNYDTVGAYSPKEGKFIFLSYDKQAENNRKEYAFVKGGEGAKPVIGDWDGDKCDSVGIRKADGEFILTNKTEPGEISEISCRFSFGPVGSKTFPLAGDWDGDGKDTVGVYNSETATFYLKNANSAGEADIVIKGQAKGSMPTAGDWNGDGTDEVGEFNPETAFFYHYDSKGNLFMQPYPYGPSGNSSAVCGDWNGSGRDSIASAADGAYHYKFKLGVGVEDDCYSLTLPADYIYPVSGNFDFNAKRTPFIFGDHCYHFQWDNKELQKYMIDIWVNLVKELNFDGYRLDLEAYETIIVPFGNQNIWRRVRERCYDEFGKKIFIMAEMDGMGNNNVHAEQDSFGVITNLHWDGHWDPNKNKRDFMVNAKIVDVAKTLDMTYYTMTLSCHDHDDFVAKGRRSAFGYMVFSPFLPWWRMGEEVNARNAAPAAHTKGYGNVLYFSDMDWSAFEDPSKKLFYEDVCRMLQLREKYKDIISPFYSRFKDRKFTDIKAQGCKLQVYAHYGRNMAIVVTAKLDETDGDIVLNIDSNKLRELRLDKYEKFEVTEELYKPQNTAVLTKNDLKNYAVNLKNNDVIFLVIKGVN